jgi:hypothetical protein
MVSCARADRLIGASNKIASTIFAPLLNIIASSPGSLPLTASATESYAFHRQRCQWQSRAAV